MRQQKQRQELEECAVYLASLLQHTNDATQLALIEEAYRVLRTEDVREAYNVVCGGRTAVEMELHPDTHWSYQILDPDRAPM